MEPGSVKDSLSPKEGGEPCFKEHGAHAFNEHLIEPLCDTIGIGNHGYSGDKLFQHHKGES